MSAEPEPTGAESTVSGPILAFMNEVAGGRRLIEGVKAAVAGGATEVAVVAPQNVPASGQMVDETEAREAAQSRVEVTQAVLAQDGIDSVGAVMDPDTQLALDDAVRAFRPERLFISCLAETRFGWLRRDLIGWAEERFDADVVHIPVRLDDDAVSHGITHTLVVATQTVASPDLLRRLTERAEADPHRYTFICPRSGAISREDVCERLATTLAAMYAQDVDATGQPMSPEPFAAVQNAIEHYRIDDILISTFAGQSAWLEEGLIDRVQAITDKPVEHVESREDEASAAAGVAQGTPVAAGVGE